MGQYAKHFVVPSSKMFCLNQGAPERQSLQLRCTLGRDPASTNGETERLQGVRRDPLWVKIREVGRGLSLADTQTGR